MRNIKKKTNFGIF